VIRNTKKASEALTGPRHAEALRIAEERFRLIMENVEDFAILLLDLEGRVVDWNQGTERLLGYRTEEILGKPFSACFTPEDREAGLPPRLLKQAAATGHAEGESWLVRKDSSRFWASGVVTALRDEAGSLRGYVTILSDLTDKKQLEEALRQRAQTLAEVDRLKDAFLAMVSHQLRNPLGTILNGVQILRQADTKGPIAEQTLDMVERQLKQVVRIVDDLLDLSRLKRGDLSLQKEPVSLVVAVTEAAAACRREIEARGQQLEVAAPAESVLVAADPVRLEQILCNLLNNASRCTQNGGKISIAVQRDDNEAVVRVTDNGAGIEPEALPHVFDLFVPGQTTSQRGLGIGLALVRRLVTLHGGAVSAHSDGPGQGSEFEVRLPLRADSPGERPSSPPQPAAVVGRPRRVLVLEDDKEAARSLSRLLRLWGHEVHVTYDGPAALHAAEEFRPEVVLVDIGLPGMDGYEVARRLRDAYAHQLCLIAMTGFGQEEDRRRALEAGFDHHVTKPADAKELRRLLAESVTQ
jgi:PAS domain S-box-containing protein